MIEVVEFRPGHLAKLNPKDGSTLSTEPGPAVTFMDGENPIAIFGWHFVNRGTVQLWAHLGQGIHEKPIAFHRAVRGLIEASFGKCVVRRMQMSVRVGFQAGRDWAESLGFQCEGVMRKYGSDGMDYWLFARIRD